MAHLEKIVLPKMQNNLHVSFAEANLDFEISSLKATMIQSIVSFKLSRSIEYHELTVVQLIGQRCTVMVNTSDQLIEFTLPQHSSKSR